MRPQRAVTGFMRITALTATGHNRVRRIAAETGNRGIDDALHVLGGQTLPAPVKIPVAPDATESNHLNPSAHPLLRQTQRSGQMALFDRRLDFARREKWVRFDDDTQPAQPFRQAEWKVRRHFDGAHTKLAQQFRQQITQFAHAKFLLTPAQRQNPVHGRLPARAINFQIAHHQMPATGDLEVNEGVGREQAGGVKQVGVLLAGGDDEPGGFHAAIPNPADGATSSENGLRWPASNLWCAKVAIIPALSVQSLAGANNNRSPRFAHSPVSFSRSRLLIETPPARLTVRTRYSSAALSSLPARTSTTAS